MILTTFEAFVPSLDAFPALAIDLLGAQIRVGVPVLEENELVDGL
jgi:hypothetical protein